MKKTSPLKAYFDNLPYKDYKPTRQLIADKCFVSVGAVKQWINGVNQVPPLAKKEIERIAKQKIF